MENDKNVSTVITGEALDPNRLRYIGDKNIQIFVDDLPATFWKIETIPCPTEEKPDGQTVKLYFASSNK